MFIRLPPPSSSYLSPLPPSFLLFFFHLSSSHLLLLLTFSSFHLLRTLLYLELSYFIPFPYFSSSFPYFPSSFPPPLCIYLTITIQLYLRHHHMLEGRMPTHLYTSLNCIPFDISFLYIFSLKYFKSVSNLCLLW